MTGQAFPVHPFPARMAPELALARLPDSTPQLHILDPMMGSGTIPVLAGTRGHVATGFDIDPLACLIATTWARPLPAAPYLDAAERVATTARRLRRTTLEFADDETADFVDRWFDPVARARLSRLAAAIENEPARLRRALWCAFSRLIITKDRGASRARDVSHSRPHRVRDVTDFDPVKEFERAANVVLQRHRSIGDKRPAAADVRLGRADARDLPLPPRSVDLVMTSPPYLVAIDYLRGHRLSLVWMGHSMSELRELRGTAIGSPRGYEGNDMPDALMETTLRSPVSPRATAVLRRYVTDLAAMLDEAARVLKKKGRMTLVVADATMEGQPISISEITDRLASLAGFHRVERIERELPPTRRYLPPPSRSSGSLAGRMRREICLSYVL